MEQDEQKEGLKGPVIRLRSEYLLGDVVGWIEDGNYSQLEPPYQKVEVVQKPDTKEIYLAVSGFPNPSWFDAHQLCDEGMMGGSLTQVLKLTFNALVAMSEQKPDAVYPCDGETIMVRQSTLFLSSGDDLGVNFIDIPDPKEREKIFQFLWRKRSTVDCLSMVELLEGTEKMLRYARGYSLHGIMEITAHSWSFRYGKL